MQATISSTTSRLRALATVATLAGTLAVAGAASAQGTGPTRTYKRDLPAALVRQAKISEAAASATARARVPNGRIDAVELERENGNLIYSYELRVPGKSGIEEVNVNAVTGSVVDTQHEGAGAEKGEAGGEKGEKGEAGESGGR